MRFTITLIIILALSSCTGGSRQSLELEEIQVSLHNVLAVESEGRYYISGTTDLLNVWEGQTQGFHVYSSTDLENWDKSLAWEPSEGSEWNQRAWGAVILPWQDKYVMLGAVWSSERKHHGILTMEAELPGGPYKLRSSEYLLKGIDPQVVIESDKTPWLVVGGRAAILAAPLSGDLSKTTAEPDTILHASWVPGAEPAGDGKWFHDAPVFHRLGNGELIMLFSANYAYPDGIAYATFKLRSSTGKVTGPWTSEGVFLPNQHGASFWRRLDGELMLTVKPQGVPIEKGHPEFIRLMESDEDIHIHPDGQTEVPTSARQGRSVEDFLYIENKQLKLGIDTSMGGAITYLEIKKYGENIVNDFDLGRQIQISFFGGPNPFIPSPDKKPHERWTRIGWNPIQAGDVFGYGSKITNLYVGEDSIFVSCIPMHWPLENVPGQCIYESRIKLNGNKAFVSAKIINKREDKTQYPARSSELPAVYSNGTYYRLYTYDGDRPFTRDEMSLIPKRNVEPGKFPWSRFQATENWAALVNEEGIGMAVYSPVTQRFLGGFTGTEGEGSTFDIPCGYICPIGFSVLDHNIQYEYSYVMLAGKLEDMRKDIYKLALKDKVYRPCYNFNSGRQGWYYRNAKDSGWPVEGNLEIIPQNSSWSLNGPDISLLADSISSLELEASIPAGAASFSFQWNRIVGSETMPANSVEIDIIPGNRPNLYVVRLEGMEGFEGLITGISLQFPDMDQDDEVIINKICFK